MTYIIALTLGTLVVKCLSHGWVFTLSNFKVILN